MADDQIQGVFGQPVVGSKEVEQSPGFDWAEFEDQIGAPSAAEIAEIERALEEAAVWYKDRGIPPPRVEPFKYDACRPALVISLDLMPGTYIGPRYTNAQGGIAAQTFGALQAMAQTSVLDTEAVMRRLRIAPVNVTCASRPTNCANCSARTSSPSATAAE